MLEVCRLRNLQELHTVVRLAMKSFMAVQMIFFDQILDLHTRDSECTHWPKEM